MQLTVEALRQLSQTIHHDYLIRSSSCVRQSLDFLI
jgi:hypothetical protein